MNLDEFILDLEDCMSDLLKLHNIDCVCRSAKYRDELYAIFSQLMVGLGFRSDRMPNSKEERENYALIFYLRHALVLSLFEHKESVESLGLFPLCEDFGDVLNGFERAIKNGNIDVACFKKYIDNVVEYVLNDDLSIKTSVSYCENGKEHVIDGNLKFVFGDKFKLSYPYKEFYVLHFSSDELDRKLVYNAVHWESNTADSEGVTFLEDVRNRDSLYSNYKANFCGGHYIVNLSEYENEFVEFIIEKSEVYKMKRDYEKWQVQRTWEEKKEKVRER